MCITFSNEAANNLFLRIGKVLGKIDNGIVVRTFHGFSADLLREHGEKIGIKKDFKILDPDQAKVILHRNMKVNANYCHKYIATIGTAKDLGISLPEFQYYLEKELERYQGVIENSGEFSKGQFLEDKDRERIVHNLEKRFENLNFELQTLYLRDDGEKKKDIVRQITRIGRVIELKKFVTIWTAYEKLKEKGNYQDYSDLNNNVLKLLEADDEIGKRYDYLVVDEFQDTNKVQLDFIAGFAKHKNVTVVGDINQSIYRFRGAYKENLSLFKKSFGVLDSEIFTLAKSYRSPNTVLRTAHKLIENNYVNKDECFFVENAHNREGDKIEIYEMKDGKEEARKVVELIEKEISEGRAYEDICVMFRAHQQGRVIRRALDGAKIPYFAVAKASLMKQKSVRTTKDYLIILNKLKNKEKGGEEAWWDLAYQLDFKQDDLIKIGRYIKDYQVKVKKLSLDSQRQGSSDVLDYKKKLEVAKEGGNIEGMEGLEGGGIISIALLNGIDKMDLSDSGKMAGKILIEKIKMLLPLMNLGISQLIKEVYRISGLSNEQKTREEKEIMTNLNKFYETAKVHEDLYDSDLESFLYYLDILDSLGIEIEAASLEEAGVRLMTSHSTKGLEYKVVIVTNMAQGRFPIERYAGNNLIPTILLPEVREEIKHLDEEQIDNFIIDYEKHHQLLEERRLAYVSFTRAIEKLILTYAYQYGNKRSYPSKFLNEIDYKKNDDISFAVDLDEKFVEPPLEIKRADEFSSVLGSQDFDTMLMQITNDSVRAAPEKTHTRFSPSALNLFEKCQKEFEYKYVYNMPEKKTQSWEAMRLGSFVHSVLEKGVLSSYDSAEQFLELAREMSMDEDWNGIELNEAETLIRVFYERNKDRFGELSKTEQYLPLKLAGMDFIGFADRIDFNSSGEAEIVDYKTGKWAISPKERNWQLGFYVLAAQEKYGRVRRVTLDMLRQDKPLDFELDDKGNAVCISSDRMSGFNIYEVEQELVKTAHEILEAYKSGFKPCAVEENCEFCNEYVYSL